MKEQSSDGSTGGGTARRAWLLAALLAISGVAVRQASDPGISITAPLDGVTLAPGSTVPVRVQVDPSLKPGMVFVSAGRVDRSGSSPFGATLSDPPYEGVLTIPVGASGTYSMDAFIGTRQDGL